MNTSGSSAPAGLARAVNAWYADGFIWVELADGRRVGFPPEKFPRLRAAAPADLSKVRVEARGKALRWEELDEDLSVDGILVGRWWST